MKRLLDNPSKVRRWYLFLGFFAVAFLYGLWELWLAAVVTGSVIGYLFAAIFIGGAIYGVRAMLAEAHDLVVSFDADIESGNATIRLWRLFHMKQIDTTLDQITGWHHFVQTGARDERSHFLLAREKSHDGMLRFALEPEMTIPDELRRIAPQAIADFERATGWQEV